MVNIYIELMVGLLGVILGFITMKYKLGYLVSGVNIKKYDNDKVASIVSNLSGGISITRNRNT